MQVLADVYRLKMEKDVRIFNNLFRQIEWYPAEGWKVVQEKERQGIKDQVRKA